MRASRLAVRQAYGCDCDGERRDAGGVGPMAVAARGELAAIESCTGEAVSGCPWRVFREPDVIAVLQAYDWHESGQCAEWWGADPEWWLVEGVRFFHRVLATCREDQRKTERKAGAPGVKPPLGRVVQRVTG